MDDDPEAQDAACLLAARGFSDEEILAAVERWRATCAPHRAALESLDPDPS